MTRPYQARSLKGAQNEVRRLRKCVLDLIHENMRLARDRRTLAKLAAEGPAFFNPLEAMAAEKIRDEILLRECRLNFDGSPIASSPAPTEGNS